MKSGLLWYDGDPQRSLEEKVARAVHRYRQKYGRIPTTCYVHPWALNGRGPEAISIACTLDAATATIRVVPAANMLLHHFWLGESEAREAKGDGKGAGSGARMSRARRGARAGAQSSGSAQSLQEQVKGQDVV